MRDLLSELLSKSNGKYSCFLSWASITAKSEIWGMGIMSAYSVRPYACELQGSKAGRFLKAQSTPKENRQCYFLDERNNFIEELRYAKYLPRKNKWIVYRTFYQHEDDNVIEYAFDSEMEDSQTASLNYVSVTKFSAGDAVSSHSLYAKGKYIEEYYERVNGENTKITQRIWSDTYVVREYEAIRSEQGLCILETTGNGKIKIYPSQ